MKPVNCLPDMFDRRLNEKIMIYSVEASKLGVDSEVVERVRQDIFWIVARDVRHIWVDVNREITDEGIV